MVIVDSFQKGLPTWNTSLAGKLSRLKLGKNFNLDVALPKYNGIYPRLVLKGVVRETYLYRLSIQYAVSQKAGCVFPSSDARFCFLIDLVDKYDDFVEVEDDFHKIWFGNSWIEFDMRSVELDHHIFTVGKVISIGFPLFTEDSIKDMGG